jgi:hypothetical protein
VEQVKKYIPVTIIILLATAVSGLALFVSSNEALKSGEDTLGIDLWFVPIAYLLIAIAVKYLLYDGQYPLGYINKPVFAYFAFLLYAIAGVLLFLPISPDFKWHYVVGAGMLAYIFLG